jgi:hypothetical protein
MTKKRSRGATKGCRTIWARACISSKGRKSHKDSMPCVRPPKKICHQILHFHTNFSSNRVLSVLNKIDSIYFMVII